MFEHERRERYLNEAEKVYRELLESAPGLTPVGGTYWKATKYGIFAPTNFRYVIGALNAVAFGEGKKLVDFGSGDGRVVEIAHLMGGEATGIEHDDSLVQLSIQAFKELRDRKIPTPPDSSIISGNAMEYNLGNPDIVWIYMAITTKDLFIDKFCKEAGINSKLILFDPNRKAEYFTGKFSLKNHPASDSLHNTLIFTSSKNE